ncbi:MAG TPA: succinate dehydrogenase, hydrophobic membrane anchor protein [Paracoccaceae bacterium]|nr:succinate dehydrogenase, hydrophobic membrane anchor protein [Paracoccaceae bacterium]
MSQQNTDFRTPRARAAGLGSAKDGVHHWWNQRVTAIALIPLGILFVFPFVNALGQPHAEVIEIYQSPWNAIVAVLFLGVTALHLQQGLQVVIEDYVHSKPLLTAALLVNIGFCWVLGLVGVFAVLRIALAG